ncbi:MAG: protein-export chaperone SecB [Desulfatirhabdiaceae bacterium]
MSGLIVKNIYLQEIRFAVNPNFNRGFKTNHIPINHQIKVASKITDGNIHTDLTISTPPPEQTKGYPFHFFLAITGIFEIDGDMKEEEISQCSKISCPSIVFPYLREALADITRRSGFPPLHIQSVNFAEMEKSRPENGSDFASKHPENKA